MDLKINMTFAPGSTFIFGSWVCEADSEGKLRPKVHEVSTSDVEAINEITRDFVEISISARQKEDPIYNQSDLDPASEYRVRLPFRLRNSASVFEILAREGPSGCQQDAWVGFYRDL